MQVLPHVLQPITPDRQLLSLSLSLRVLGQPSLCALDMADLELLDEHLLHVRSDLEQERMVNRERNVVDQTLWVDQVSTPEGYQKLI